MNFNNIRAIIANDITTVIRVKWRFLELTYFPLSSILIWGLFAIQSRAYAAEAGLIVLVVNLFWSFSQLAQQQANILVMEDLWSFSIKHILIAGVSETEYIIAKLITSTSAAIIITSFLLLIANAFGAPLLANLGTVAAIAGIALLGSVSLAILISGTIIMLGKEYGFLSWSMLQVFVFLSAPFFSPDIFPVPIRWITEIMPFTYVFQSARAIATNVPVQNSTLLHALSAVIAYFIFAWPYYYYSFRRARKTGMLAKMSS